MLDFSTAIAIGAVATPAGLRMRLFAYLLLATVFGGVLFLYANYGSALALLPAPSTALGPVATSVAFGTVIYLAVVTAVTGWLLLRPWLFRDHSR